MRSVLLVVFLQFLCARQSVQESNELLKVSLYYECLCPYSVDFINKQFYPAYQKIGSSLQVHFVPYGNANHSKIDGEWNFTCQHDYEECWGNMAQACGLAKQHDQDKQVEFVNCIMEQEDPASKDAVIECSPKLEIAADLILACTEDAEGGELLAELGDETNGLQPELTGVPYIIFNDKFHRYVDQEAAGDFLRAACLFLPSKPDGCPLEDNKLGEEAEED